MKLSKFKKCSLMLVMLTLIGGMFAGCGAKQPDDAILSTEEAVTETERDIMLSSFENEAVAEVGSTETIIHETEDYAGYEKLESEYPFSDRKILINDVEYSLGCRPSEFLDGVWELDEGQVDENGEILIYPNNYRSVKLIGINSSDVIVLSFDSSDEVHHNFLDMPVIGIEVPEYSTVNVSCGGVSKGMTESEMVKVLGEPASGFRGKYTNCAWYTTSDSELKLEIDLPKANEDTEPVIEAMRLIDWSNQYTMPLASISKRED